MGKDFEYNYRMALRLFQYQPQLSHSLLFQFVHTFLQFTYL
jgi:hypothetical protein